MYPELDPDQVSLIRTLYGEVQNISEVRRRTGHSWRIIAKYVGSDRRRQLTEARAIQAYKLTGSVQGAASVLGVHPKTVWRRLISAGFVLTGGAKDSARLYKAIRRRINRSQWCADVLERDGRRCQRCHTASDIVHHVVYRTAAMRDQVFRERPELDPFASRRQLRRFIDLVVELCEQDVGETLCHPCHTQEHSAQGRNGA